MVKPAFSNLAIDIWVHHSWLAGAEDFGVSPRHSSHKTIDLGKLDRESGELWFWGLVTLGRRQCRAQWRRPIGSARAAGRAVSDFTTGWLRPGYQSYDLYLQRCGALEANETRHEFDP